MGAYYNEWDSRAAAWLRELVKAGHIPNGTVDDRSVEYVEPVDVTSVSHFFAGIGGWAYALRLAGWPDGQPVWTASLPCQPFSVAGKGLGTDDDRHLWPVFAGLVSKCRPSIIFGEQVASPAGRAWLGSVRSDLEALGYSLGASDLCAASAGAPHVRQRLFWGAVRLADCHSFQFRGWGRGKDDGSEREAKEKAWQRERVWVDAGPAGKSNRLRLGNADRQRLEGPRLLRKYKDSARLRPASLETWRSSGLLLCADGRARPVAPIARRLDDGIPHRVGLLRGYGNAIVPQVAAHFIRAFVSALDDL